MEVILDNSGDFFLSSLMLSLNNDISVVWFYDYNKFSGIELVEYCNDFFHNYHKYLWWVGYRRGMSKKMMSLMRVFGCYHIPRKCVVSKLDIFRNESEGLFFDIADSIADFKTLYGNLVEESTFGSTGNFIFSNSFKSSTSLLSLHESLANVFSSVYKKDDCSGLALTHSNLKQYIDNIVSHGFVTSIKCYDILENRPYYAFVGPKSMLDQALSLGLQHNTALASFNERIDRNGGLYMPIPD